MIRDMKVVKRRDGRQRVTDGKEVRKKQTKERKLGYKKHQREEVIPMCLSPKRTDAISRQTNERNVNSNSDPENTHTYLLDCY